MLVLLEKNFLGAILNTRNIGFFKPSYEYNLQIGKLD